MYYGAVTRDDSDHQLLDLIKVADSTRQEWQDLTAQAESIAAQARARYADLQLILGQIKSLARGEPPSKAEPNPLPSVPRQIRNFFRDHPDAKVSANDLREAGVEAEVDHLRSALHRLLEKGFLERVEPGVYALLKPGKEAGRSS